VFCLLILSEVDIFVLMHTIFVGSQFSLNLVATRILRLKCSKINFGWGSTPDPAGGAYSAPPDPLAGFKGPSSKGGERKGGSGGVASTFFLRIYTHVSGYYLLLPRQPMRRRSRVLSLAVVCVCSRKNWKIQKLV